MPTLLGKKLSEEYIAIAHAKLDKRNNSGWFKFARHHKTDSRDQSGQLEILCHSRRLALLDVTNIIKDTRGFQGNFTLVGKKPKNDHHDHGPAFIVSGTPKEILDNIIKSMPLRAINLKNSPWRVALFDAPQVQKFCYPHAESVTGTLRLTPTIID